MEKKKDLFVGFDIGSSCLHYAVINEEREIVYSAKPVMHFADSTCAIKEAMQDIIKRFGSERIRNTAFTGGGAKIFPSVMKGVTFNFESVAIPAGTEIIAPEAKYVFHIGAKDPYFFDLSRAGGKRVIQEYRTGSKCGGGSGTLIEKQCRRLFEKEVEDENSSSIRTVRGTVPTFSGNGRKDVQLRLEEMFKRAEEEAATSKEPSEFLARCGVVIQSDLIHKQNEGAKREDNLAGLFKTVARNYKIDVLGNREIDGSQQAIATGGVLTNELIRRNLEEFLGASIKRPKHHHNVAAIGIALKGMEEGNSFVFDPGQLDKVTEHSREQREFAPSLKDCLKNVNESSLELGKEIKEGTDVIIGIDGGSTTTKGALVDRKGRLLDKLYIKTHGDPQEALKNVINYLSRHKDKVNVQGVAVTGSARKLYERILVSKKKTEELTNKGIEITDRVTDEITCHALGTKHHDPLVDTIFEIGGQDMKFTSFSSSGTVKEAKMNYSCQAGSGQTLENLADMVDLDVRSSLQEFGLVTEKTPIIDSTCGVFMEMDVNRLIAEGFSREEIAAAVLRATAASYYHKFVGGAQHVGQRCSAQGGPPLGKAFLAALAQVTEKEINAYPHREMFGAWGAALDVLENIKKIEKEGKEWGSAFRGWNLTEMDLAKEQVYCKELFGEKSCGTRNCLLDIFSISDDRIITGGFCPKGNSEGAVRPKINYVDKYHLIYEKHFKNYGCLLSELEKKNRTQIDRIDADNTDILKIHPDNLSKISSHNSLTVGIRRATTTLGPKGIWSAALLKRLGFSPVVTPRSDEQIARIGVENTRTEFCVARKLVTGHAVILNDHPGIDYLFNPSFIKQRQEKPPDLKYCIYTESEGYILNDVLSLDKNKQINPILHYGDDGFLARSIKDEFGRLGFRFAVRRIKEAIRYANRAEEEFRGDLYQQGDRFLDSVRKKGEKAYIGLGRDYVLLDPEASSNSGAMFSQVRGLNYIPQIFLEHRFADIPLDEVVENEFWVESVSILKANLFVANEPDLFPIRMMNFGCGPDSLKIYHEEEIQQKAGKPLLGLLTDAQTNNAPFVTRTEAFERVVAGSRPKGLEREDVQIRIYPKEGNEKRTWLIPYMGDGSLAVAAGLRHFGIEAQALPTKTQRGAGIVCKYITTEVCQPLKGVVGDALGFLEEKIKEKGKEYVEQNYLIMIPSADGPCRFGKYKEALRNFADKEGYEKIPIVGPSSENDYFDIPLANELEKVKLQKILFKGILASDLLEDITLRFRPYAKDREGINGLKKERLRQLEHVLERGAKTEELVRWGEETVRAFKETGGQNNGRFPLILYAGEIYMRQHDPFTNWTIEKLEEQGLEMIRGSVTEWLDYVNGMNLRNLRREIILGFANRELKKALENAKKFAASFIKRTYTGHVERKIAHPFHKVLSGRHTIPSPMKIIKTLEREHEFHGDIEGESPISSGEAYYLMHDLIKPEGDAIISGMFHVGPFTCMQEGAATAKIEAKAKELRKRKPDLIFPIIHAFFGDSPDPNLDCEIAVFREQCYQKREILKTTFHHLK